MASKNLVILIGNLGADPESRDVGDTTVCKFRLATSETWKDKSGEKQERTDWHSVEVWGKSAENCQKYLSKGRSVCVEGSIRYDTLEADDGTTKYFTKIKAHRVDFLGGKGEGSSEAPSTKPNDSIPF